MVVVLIAASAVAARFTESNKFCGTDCHEMWPYRDTWEKSTHKDTDCVQCHIPPGAVNFAVTKLYASREVWVHFTGQVKAPIKVTRHIPNRACKRSGCHTSADIEKTLSLGRPAPVKFQHGSEGHAKQLCIACHAALVHEGAPGVDAPPANSMASCFSCHTDGTKDCTYCHKPPHEDRGPCQDCHDIGSWGSGKDFAHPGGPLVGKHAQVSCEDCHTKGVVGEAGRLRHVPRRPAQRAAATASTVTASRRGRRRPSCTRRRGRTSRPVRSRCSATPVTRAGSARSPAARATAGIRRRGD